VVDINIIPKRGTQLNLDTMNSTFTMNTEYALIASVSRMWKMTYMLLQSNMDMLEIVKRFREDRKSVL
jgi:hypothetical protein